MNFFRQLDKRVIINRTWLILFIKLMLVCYLNNSCSNLIEEFCNSYYNVLFYWLITWYLKYYYLYYYNICSLLRLGCEREEIHFLPNNICILVTTLSSGVWFGLKYHDGWDIFYWVYSSVIYSYKNWLGGWGTGFANKYCYEFVISTGLWRQQECITDSNYICEKGK